MNKKIEKAVDKLLGEGLNESKGDVRYDVDSDEIHFYVNNVEVATLEKILST